MSSVLQSRRFNQNLKKNVNIDIGLKFPHSNEDIETKSILLFRLFFEMKRAFDSKKKRTQSSSWRKRTECDAYQLSIEIA